MNTATIPAVEPSTLEPIRYYAVALAPSMSGSSDSPFVVKNQTEARELLYSISEGLDNVAIREWVDGAVIERRTSFVGAQTDDAELWCYIAPPGETEDPMPEFIVKRGPRGGLNVEKLGPPRRRRDPSGVQAPPILASARVIP